MAVKKYLARDFNEHIKKDYSGYEKMHRRHGYGEKNESKIGYKTL